MTTTETESIYALGIEAEVTVLLAKDFYSCVVKDLRDGTGAHHKAKNPSLPSEEEERRVMSGFPSPLNGSKPNGSSNGSGA